MAYLTLVWKAVFMTPLILFWHLRKNMWVPTLTAWSIDEVQGKINKRSSYFLACLRNRRNHGWRRLASLWKVPRNTYKCGLVGLKSLVGNRQSVAHALRSDLPEYCNNIYKLWIIFVWCKSVFALRKAYLLTKYMFMWGPDRLIRSSLTI